MTRDIPLLPPYSLEAEQSVLGAILLEGNTALDRIEDLIAESDFYRPEHRRIFAGCCRLANLGRPIDVITVSETLGPDGNQENAVDIAYLGHLAQNVPGAANIRFYAQTVRDRSLKRRLLALAVEIQEDCNLPGADVAEIIGKADSAMVQLLDNHQEDPALLYDVMTDAIQDIDDRATGCRPSGLLTGIDDLDAITGGLEPGQLVIVAARPSTGKTALALNMADYLVRQGKTVVFFSLEMQRRELAQRLIALRTGISVSSMRTGKLQEGGWSQISACRADTDGQRLILIDRPAVGVSYVRAAARKIRRQHGLDVIFVDYLGLMRGEGQNRNQEIGSLSRGLKALAKELNIPIVALAQLNRATETRQDKRPQLSDLRDSGEIEQDADIVAMLHREDLSNPAPEWRGKAELIIRKNRNGPLGDVILALDGPTMQFTRYTGLHPRQQVMTKISKGGNTGSRGFDD